MTDAKQQAPDELVERAASILIDWSARGKSAQEQARAVLAEIAKSNTPYAQHVYANERKDPIALAVWNRDITWETWLASQPGRAANVAAVDAAEKRVAELEAELGDLGALLKRGVELFGADDMRIKALEEENAKLKEESDGLRVKLLAADEQGLEDEVENRENATMLATVTRERDEARDNWATSQRELCSARDKVDSLTRELAEAKRRIGELHVDRDIARGNTESARKELAEAKDALDSLDHGTVQRLHAVIAKHEDALFEAREELRWKDDERLALREALSDLAGEAPECESWGQADHLLAGIRQADAHRAKTSGAAGKSTESVNRTENPGCRESGSIDAKPTAPELPYETAPRLMKGVRYRVVECADTNTAYHDSVLPVRHEFVATGQEELWTSGGRVPNDGFYALATGLGLQRVVRVAPEKAQNGLDGIAEKLAAAGTPVTRGVNHDGGSERSGQVADQARKQRESCLKPNDDGPPRVGDVGEATENDWAECRYAHCAHSSQDRGCVRRTGQPEAKAEAMSPEQAAHNGKTLLGGPGPHTETVAELAAEQRRIVKWLADFSECFTYDGDGIGPFKEIRAERAGRKDR